MTIGDFIKDTSKELGDAGIESARLDGIILLEDAFHKDRALLLAHADEVIPNPIFAKLYKQRLERKKHIPLAYIRGLAPFYGRDFIVDSNVLVPRPETEDIIALLKDLAMPNPTIVDIGTGSGCVGITAKLELPKARVGLYDIDKKALVVAKKNIARFSINIDTHEQDMLPSDIKCDILLANLPYVPQYMDINKAASYEPRLAIFSGVDGLDLYKKLWLQLSQLQTKPKLIITESLPAQHHFLASLARKDGYYLAAKKGFVQAFVLTS